MWNKVSLKRPMLRMKADIHIVGTHSSNHGGLDGSRIGRYDRKRYGESEEGGGLLSDNPVQKAPK